MRALWLGFGFGLFVGCVCGAGLTLGYIHDRRRW